MIVLDATFRDVRYNRDFGRVEATVTLLVKRRNEPVRPMSVITNVPARGTGPLRKRFIQDAAQLIERIHIPLERSAHAA